MMGNHEIVNTIGGSSIDETSRLIASDKVEGTAVFNRKSERLGTVQNFMVDKYTGHVAYAVMSFGGFLGIGESYHPLPWRALDYDPARAGYVIDLDRAKLEAAPSYKASDEPNWADKAYGARVDEFYGLPPYWA